MSGAVKPRRWRTIALAVGLSVIVIALGLGGYLVGRSGGEDLEAARSAGVAQGTQAGERLGDAAGYKKGFSAGHKRGFAQAYDSAYHDAYAKAFRDVGVAPPVRSDVPVTQVEAND